MRKLRWSVVEHTLNVNRWADAALPGGECASCRGGGVLLECE